MFYRLAAIAGTIALLSQGVSYAAAVPVPGPTAAPKLKVIASVLSTPRCAEIVTHANSAIGSALDNDVTIQQLITRLRAVNLDDGNPIHRRNGLAALGDFAKNLTLQSRSADDEVKRLRALAARSKDPNEKKELKAFADSLGGALLAATEGCARSQWLSCVGRFPRYGGLHRGPAAGQQRGLRRSRSVGRLSARYLRSAARRSGARKRRPNGSDHRHAKSGARSRPSDRNAGSRRGGQRL